MSLDEASDLNGEGWHRLEVLLPRRQSTGGMDDPKVVTRGGRLLAYFVERLGTNSMRASNYWTDARSPIDALLDAPVCLP